MISHIFIFFLRERQRQTDRDRQSNHDEKKLHNVDSCLYQFVTFTFLLKPLHKMFFTIFTVGLKQKVKI